MSDRTRDSRQSSLDRDALQPLLQTEEGPATTTELFGQFDSISDVPDDLDGRRQGQGDWLEVLTVNRLREGGRLAVRGAQVFEDYHRHIHPETPPSEVDENEKQSWEVDVLAVDPKTHKRYLVQCKDWTHTVTDYLGRERPAEIPPQVIMRLVSLAVICEATPVLIRTCDLSPAANRLATLARVRDGTVRDLHTLGIPSPKEDRVDTTGEVMRYNPCPHPILCYEGRRTRKTYPPHFEEIRVNY